MGVCILRYNCGVTFFSFHPLSFMGFLCLQHYSKYDDKVPIGINQLLLGSCNVYPNMSLSDKFKAHIAAAAAAAAAVSEKGRNFFFFFFCLKKKVEISTLYYCKTCNSHVLMSLQPSRKKIKYNFRVVFVHTLLKFDEDIPMMYLLHFTQAISILKFFWPQF